MIKECQHFKMSADHYLQMSNESRDLLCRTVLPDEYFRFATFEQNDFRKGIVTCQLYNYIPASVFVSVETPIEIETAIDKLIELNPEAKWWLRRLSYFDHDESGHACVTVELQVSGIPMRVSAGGEFIFL